MSQGRVTRARNALLLLLVLAFVACGGESGSQGRSGGGDSSGGRSPEGTPGRAEETARKGVAPAKTTTAAPEATGATRGGTSPQGPGSGDERSGPGGGPVVSDTLTAGATDATGGPLARGRMVSFYGHPLSGAMGKLGQLEPPAMVRELKKRAEAYTEIDPDRPAIPTIELIASVAQPDPGPDGLYLAPTEDFWIEKYAKLAEENGCLLLLDVQIGYSTIADEVERLMPYLERPYVHLAVDTEYDMIPPDVPAKQVGSSPGRDIMQAARTLSRLVEEENLPPKALVIHQFRDGMIQNKQPPKPVPNVEMVLHADGFGTPEQKFVKYDALVRDEPIQYGGFKLFYDQDTPLLSPSEVLDRLEPNPAVISYQ